jgi:hypothetical protein
MLRRFHPDLLPGEIRITRTGGSRPRGRDPRTRN